MAAIFYKLNICLIFLIAFHPVNRGRDMETMETDILKYVNEDRIANGLSPLQMNELESSLAAKHSLDMSVGKVKFGHDGFKARAKTIQKALGSIEVGENVAEGSMTAREVVDGWLHSPGHKKNIEGNFTLTGIGYASDKKGNIYFTQIFSR
ncbi:MAG TPA: CAP domain-containing protein [Puia sp.]|nr:CAP domain-containing protein [Puia sp.]